MKSVARAALALVLLALVAGGSWLAGRFHHRPGVDAVRAHLAPAARAEPGAVTATWFGVTAVLLTDGATSLLVDPFFTRPPGWLNLLLDRPIAPDEAAIARGLSRARPKNLAAVLVSHSHFDHAMDAGVVARLAGASLVGSASTVNLGRGAGLPESQLQAVAADTPLRYGAFTVTFLPSRHAGATGGRPLGDIAQPLVPPARYSDYRQGGTWSILVEHARGSVLLHGSAGVEPGALQGRRADVAFLGVAVIDRLDGYVQETLDAVGARRVFPTHWDDFTRPLADAPLPMPFGVDLDGFFAGLTLLRPQLQVQTLAPWQPVVLF